MACRSSGSVMPRPSGERSFGDRFRSSQYWGWVNPSSACRARVNAMSAS
ncbi:hypothetical protein SGLAM104S_08025 [Streptomyces glaucescens]